MQNQIIFMTPPKVELVELKNLFFQLCSKACNLKCKNCYIERNPYKNEEDFIPLEKIKQTLSAIKGKELNSIYLTGGEPMLHPDFNQILRICLKFSNTTILTNGVMINDKKARFLRKIDDESNFETIYRISLDSTNELENDNFRARGSYRKALSAIFSLLKYEFNPIISTVNYKNRPEEEIFEEFKTFFNKKGVEFEDINLKVILYFSKGNENSQTGQIEKQDDIDVKKLDCYNSRTVSASGVYACPMLVNDYRAKLGTAINNFSNINYLDCEKCAICASNKKKVLVNDWM